MGRVGPQDPKTGPNGTNRAGLTPTALDPPKSQQLWAPNMYKKLFKINKRKPDSTY